LVLFPSILLNNFGFFEHFCKKYQAKLNSEPNYNLKGWGIVKNSISSKILAKALETTLFFKIDPTKHEKISNMTGRHKKW